VSGIGILSAPDFLVARGKIGPLLFEANHTQHSPWWQLLILYGFFLFFTISYALFMMVTKRKRKVDLFILLLIFLSLLLIIVPEFIYVKDIYPEHYRANTMFKLVFQAFIMLSLVSGFVVTRILLSIKNTVFQKSLFSAFFLVTTLLLVTVLSYPYFAITSYYNNLQKHYSLDGTVYLKNTYPDDYSAITWIQNHISGQPVILEAQGDSYTDYARISSYTGLPTVLGWTVHEWLWRGTYDIPAPRIEDVKTLYETSDVVKTKILLKKYNISYIYIGELEQQKYQVAMGKFMTLGKTIFKKNNTTIIKLSS
jgi:YYY domain-containing protein